jgi:outer membrane protein assembly factor BamB
VAKGVSGSADSLWVRLDDGPPVAHHIPIDSYGNSSASWEKTAPGPPLDVPEDGTYQLRISLREGPGVCLDHIVITAPDGKRRILQAEELVADQIEIINEPEQHFQIVNADGVQRKLRRTFDYGHARAEGYYANYPYADKMTNVLTQMQTQTLAAGETITFANLLYLDRGDSESRALMPAGDGVWLVTGPRPTAIGLALNRPGTETGHAGPFMLDTNSLTVADAERGRSSSPAPDWALNLLNKARTDAHPPQQPAQPRNADLPPLATIRTHELPSTITALASRDAQLLAGTENGTLVLIGADGNTVWTRDLKAGIRTVAFADFADTGPACLAGTWSGAVCAFSASTGNLMWTYDCQPFHGRTGAVATVFPADLDGDGKDEVVAGSNNWHYHGLSSRGELLWRTNTTHAGTAGAAGDHDGDGRDEIMAGTEYYWPRLLDDTGKLLRQAGAGPVTSAAAMFDADGDGHSEALFGMEDGFVRAFRNAKLDWRANAGGAPAAIRPLDVDRDGVLDIVCGSESCSVYAWQYGADTPMWRTPLPESVNDLAVAGHSVAAACDDGALYALSDDGRLTAAARFEAPVAFVVPAGHGAVAAASGTSVGVFSLENR